MRLEQFLNGDYVPPLPSEPVSEPSGKSSRMIRSPRPLAPLDYPDRPDATMESVREASNLNMIPPSHSRPPSKVLGNGGTHNNAAKYRDGAAPKVGLGRGKKREERKRMDDEFGTEAANLRLDTSSASTLVSWQGSSASSFADAEDGFGGALPKRSSNTSSRSSAFFSVESELGNENAAPDLTSSSSSLQSVADLLLGPRPSGGTGRDEKEEYLPKERAPDPPLPKPQEVGGGKKKKKAKFKKLEL